MSTTLNNIWKHLKKYKDIYLPLSLMFLGYLFLFFQQGSYPLIDVDETRYAAIAREYMVRHKWMTLFFNHTYFFEKPPLYFWLLEFSYKLFGAVNEMSVRFPIALTALTLVMSTYYFGKKAVSRTFGYVSALILMTSVEFLLLTKIAILDMVLSTFIALSIYSGFMTYYCNERYKKYFWWLMYMFSGLAVMSKGIPGLVIPIGVMGISTILTGKFKEMIKPVHCLPGIVLFLAVTLPWHLLMVQIYGKNFIHEYVIKHHLNRFIDSKDIGRVQPFYFFIPVFIVGFLPWISEFCGVLCDLCRNAKSKLFNSENEHKTLLILLFAYFFTTFIFFSASSTKLVTYILPLYPAAAMLTGYYWTKFLTNNKENEKFINVSTTIWSVIFLIIGLGGYFVFPAFADKIKLDVAPTVQTASALLIFCAVLFLAAKQWHKKNVMFASRIVFMLGVSLIMVNQVFPMIYNSGENELVSYAKYAHQKNDAQVITFGFGVRQSLVFYSDGINKVFYEVDPSYDVLKVLVSANPNYCVVAKTKDLPDMSKNIAFNTVKAGKKYSLINQVEFKK